MLGGLGTSLVTGLVFGVLPARRAAGWTRCSHWQDDDRCATASSLALRAITAHRLRSFLTLLGIAVGIAAVILLTSIGEGIHRFVLAEFSQFGTNVIGITPGTHGGGGGPPSGCRRRCGR